MSAAGKGKPGFEGGDADTGKVHRIRITLSSRNVANLEKGTPIFPSFPLLPPFRSLPLPSVLAPRRSASRIRPWPRLNRAADTAWVFVSAYPRFFP